MRVVIRFVPNILKADATVWEAITGGAEIIELGDARVEWFEGNFEDYEEDKKRRLGADALEPKRLKHKKFMR